jgi:hypothetical protein
MPAHHGFWPNHDQRPGPPRPQSPQREPEELVQVVQNGLRAFSFQHGDLLARGENLEAEIMAGTENALR